MELKDLDGKEYTFKNGLRFVYSKNILPISAITIGFNVGSLDEETKNLGVSHFLEHMVFKGTKKRPSTKIISEELSSLGADFNAYTDKNITAYVVKCPSKNLEQVIDIYGDMLANSLLTKTEVEKEKDVVIEEIKRSLDDPDVHISNILSRYIYEGCGLSHTISSDPIDIERISYKEMVDYYHKYYCLKNCVFSICTDIDIEEVKRIVGKSELMKMSKGKKNHRKEKCRIVKREKPFKYIRSHILEHTHIWIGFRTLGIHDPIMFASDIVSIVLAGTMNSRLFMDLRENNGMSYSVYVDDSSYEEGGNFGVITSVDRTKVLYNKDSKSHLGAIEIIIDNLRKIRDEGISKEELKGAIEYLENSIILELEDSWSVSDFNCRMVMFDMKPRYYYSTIIEKYKEVSLEKIKEFCQKYFLKTNMYIGIMGDYSSKEVERINRSIDKLMDEHL